MSHTVPDSVSDPDLRRDADDIAACRRRRLTAPDDPAALDRLFAALDRTGQAGTGEEAVARANYGERLRRAGQCAAAAVHLQKAIDWAPDFGGGHYNMGVLLAQTGQLAAAAAAYQNAERLMPDFPGAAINLAAILRQLGDFPGAEAAARRGLAAGGAALPATWANLAAALLENSRLAAAAHALTRGLALAPQMGEGWANLATAHKELGQGPAALSALRRALVCGVGDPGGVLAQLVQQQRHLCQWDGLAPLAERLNGMAARGESARIHPWIFLGQGAGRAAERTCATRYAAGRVKGVVPLPSLPATAFADDQTLRIGYLSNDFQQHATAVLLAETLENHDRRRFRIHAYSWGADDGGAMRRRLMAACDVFSDISADSAADAAARIRADGVQILIDLKGHTQGARQPVPAYRPAPVQAQWLGYPGTMGVDWIDYILADSRVAPFSHQPDYSESIVHLPGCYQPNDRARAIDATPATRADHGLPMDGLVFCCFNAAYKITPQVFDCWCEILKSRPDAALWLLASAPEVAANLRREAQRRGVAGERLVFAPRRPLPAYLAQYRLADLFLDTWPVGAHTTASDALWAGLPVLTLMGESFAGRVGASLLHAVGLDELIAASEADYLNKATQLADRPDALHELRVRLESGREGAALFDGRRFVRGLESAYGEMWRRWRAGLPAAAFSVESLETIP